ncbi:MAG: c-type cytochrome [Pseudomonadota bacterium]|nr:c-type cytochrome [Pseudomonadota bacterium]
MKYVFWSVVLSALLTACGGSSSGGSSDDGSADGDTTPSLATKTALGESLFEDVNLSANRSQSCSTCHDPQRAFTDGRTDSSGAVRAASLGDDGTSLGDRNAPTVTYASFSPAFSSGTRSRFNSQQDDYEGYLGGQFHDGRASDLAAQAGGPPLNPIEMGMADKASVVSRLLENSDYVAAFEYLYGDGIFDDTDAAYEAMRDAIGTYEATDEFATFDSEYDRFLAGDESVQYKFIAGKAGTGKSLFFSQQFTNCATCHQLNTQGSRTETFSGYEYHNIGVPENSELRTANSAARALAGVDSSDAYVDTGLQNNNSAVTEDSGKGKFKVPTLRNVAVTGPYMHNGVFEDLDTVIRFYDHYLTGSANTINPETGVAWADPEIADNIAYTELQDGSLLTDDDIDALVCFLRTLTDARYEDLLPDDGLCD